MIKKPNISNDKGGKIFIKIKEAKLKRDTDAIGKMDPYCIIDINDINKKTKVLKSAGKNPIWMEEFEIPYKSL